MNIRIYTDGSWSNKDRISGGYAVIMCVADKILKTGKRINAKSSNAVELWAIYFALVKSKSLAKKVKIEQIEINTDSKYSIDVLDHHYLATEETKNYEIIKGIKNVQLDLQRLGTYVTYKHVSAHSTSTLNNEADRLATEQRKLQEILNSEKNINSAV